MGVRDPEDPTLVQLLERCRRDHHSWINGDGDPYALPEEGMILGAIGGFAFGGSETLALQVAVARQWESGDGAVEFLSGGVAADVAWLVMIERSMVMITGQAGVRRWDLRVTEIFIRRAGEWQRIHRHADPLVDRHDLPALLHLLGPT